MFCGIKSVLIIHQESAFLERFKRLFSEEWRIHIAISGLDGLLKARYQRFDLILCGFSLPVIAGTEVVRSLRLGSVNNSTPIFFLTSKAPTPDEMDFAKRLHTVVIDNEIEFTGSLDLYKLTK